MLNICWPQFTSRYGDGGGWGPVVGKRTGNEIWIGVDYNGNYAWDGVVTDRFAGFGSAGATPVVGAWG